MSILRRARAWSLLASLALGCACAGRSTTLEQSWRAPDLRGLRNVVTAYVARDGSIRRSTEDRMAGKLASKGVRAVPLYAVLSEAAIADRDVARAALIAAGFDGVVVIRVVTNEAYASSGTFDDYWGAAWPSINNQNYAFADVVVRVETNVYSLADNRLVWSALSRTVDPDSTRMVIDETTTLIAAELEKRGVVVGTR